jgi:hypothetical protein
MISTDWATVLAIPAGTDVSVVLDGDEVHRGRVREVTANTLTLWERRGADAIPRPRIGRISQRFDRGATQAPRIVRTTIVAAAISALLGAVVGAMGENGLTKDDGVVIFAVGTIAGAAYAASRPPAAKYEERLIYIRP